MVPVGKVRYSQFCEIIGEKQTAVRSMIEHDRQPWFMPDGPGHRLYDGEDLLAYELFLNLTRDGTKQAVAGSAVRLSMAPKYFVGAKNRGEDLRDLCLLHYVEAENDPLSGFQETPGSMMIAAAELSEFIAKRMARIGDKYQSKARKEPTVILGLRRLTVAPIFPAYRAAQARAAAAGYRLDGDAITRVAAEAPDADDEGSN